MRAPTPLVFLSTFLVSALAACAGEAPDDLDEADGVGEIVQTVTSTTQTEAVASAMTSDFEDLDGYRILGIEPATLTFFDLDVTAKAKWTATLQSDVSWDADKVRQGADLEVTRTGTTAIGIMGVIWSVSGTLSPLGLFDVPVGPIPLAVDIGACSPQLLDCPADATPDELALCVEAASDFGCSATSPSVPLFFTPGVPASPFVDLAIGIDFTVTPNSASTTRSMFVSDDEIVAQAELGVSYQPGTESIAMPCNRPAGEPVAYVVDPFSWSPANVAAVQQPKFVIGIMDPFFGAFKIPLFDAPFGLAVPSSPAFELSGAGTSLDFGELQANNVIPTVSGLGGWSGDEGDPVQFSATVESACPVTSYVWNFSDGTTSYGPTPQRAFGDDGLFDGQLTVTDMTDMHGSGSFTVNISNLAPTASAGPNTSGAWGRPIALTGQAVDPGWNDQSTLTYSWDFGDGTPGSGGASTTHSYAAPGDYAATLTVCDDHVCDADTTWVHVRRRSAAVSYTGTNAGIYSAPALLTGAIVDEYGQPVVGGTIAFTLGGVAVGSAQTNGAGTAGRNVIVGLPAGSYLVSAAFAGNTLYEGGLASESFDVERMATSIQYSGPLKGAPNKTVTLSASLRDGLGQPLDGKTVVFRIGTQTVSAVTGAGGVPGLASAPLKLSQKNGQYLLTATWTPAGGDGSRWTGSSASATFSLQSK
jgi:hypothetical protein